MTSQINMQEFQTLKCAKADRLGTGYIPLHNKLLHPIAGQLLSEDISYRETPVYQTSRGSTKGLTNQTDHHSLKTLVTEKHQPSRPAEDQQGVTSESGQLHSDYMGYTETPVHQCWYNESAHLNSSYSCITRSSGLSSTPPVSRPMSQETVRKWEKLVKEFSYICKHAAGFNRCLIKVQDAMKTQLKVIKGHQ